MKVFFTNLYRVKNIKKIIMKRMSRIELLQECKKFGIRGVNSKSKSEIMLLINDYKAKIGNISPICSDTKEEVDEQQIKPINPKKDDSKLADLMEELISKTPKDKARKVCKNCVELGHNKTSILCELNISRNNKLKEKIKDKMLLRNCLDDISIDDFCTSMSIELDITQNLCKSLYNDIPLDEYLNRPMDMEAYLENINLLSKKCCECDKKMFCIQTNTNRIWKGHDICDVCWSKYQDYRTLTWEKIKEYKLMQCEICSSIQTEGRFERYHYDHINMFNKGNSLCIMVNEGVNIEEIYEEIDKCQVLCLSCHHIVTDIEHKMCLSRIKQSMTRSLNQEDITEDEYNTQTLHYQKIYEEKMKNIYKELRTKLFCY